MLKPLKDKVILTLEKEEKTKSGLVLSVPLEKDSKVAIVTAISNEEKELCVGDKVVISKFAGNIFEYEDSEYVVVSKDSVLAFERGE